jgi:hyperosmotically inducible protein
MKRFIVAGILCLALASVAYGQILKEVTSAARDKATTVAKDAANAAVDDSSITAEVKANLFADASLKGSKIKVQTKEGVVSLSGTVKTPKAKETAAAIAKAVTGVKSVKNKITVKK